MNLNKIVILIKTDWKNSEQQLIDCSSLNNGCNGGYVDVAWKYIAIAGGQVTNASYPYTAVQSTCKSSKGIIAAKVSLAVTYTKENDTKTMMTLLSQNRIFAVGFAVVNSLYSYKYVYTCLFYVSR